tara:strand:- start:142 stop:798 length:657 start_codon:yes stop_codon:yes gene_type:complete
MPATLPTILLLCLCSLSAAVSQESATIHLDTTEVPEHDEWGKTAQELLRDWHPRIANLLSSPGMVPPSEISLKLKKSETGVGATSGTKIVVSSGWIEMHPDDFGLVVHELVHVIQQYPGKNPVWVTEGIADYMRWAIYEGKPQRLFPVPNEDDGYTKGYQAAAGFFLWIETHKSPGIVRRLNTAMRNSDFDPSLFEELTGSDLAALWKQYTADQRKIK